MALLLRSFFPLSCSSPLGTAVLSCPAAKHLQASDQLCLKALTLKVLESSTSLGTHSVSTEGCRPPALGLSVPSRGVWWDQMEEESTVQV